MTNKFSSFFDELQKSAMDLGVDDAKAISTNIISIQDEIIELCKEPLCESYGESINCPPHTITPREFRKYIRNYHKALLFKIDVDPEILLSEKRFEAFRTIYEIAAQLENLSLNAGYLLSKGFTAGSCKPVFCGEYECQALIDGSSCRYPDLARPSMEALGINVFKLVKDVGWDINRITSESKPESVQSGLLAGLVLVA
jgi:predicted metal-binding protein